MGANGIIIGVEELAARVPDGCLLAVPPDYAGVSMAATRALVRRGVRDLHLLAVPQSSLQAELLIGAGCVATVEAGAITMGELGAAPRFTAAFKSGAIRMIDSTCPAIHAALQAAEKGIPFIPLRGLIGSDVLRYRDDWRVMDNPFADQGGDPIVLLPAIRPDIALFHAPMADAAGNVWIGRRRECVVMAHAARETLVTVEEIYDGDLLADEEHASGTLPGLYVSAVAEAPRGAWPVGFVDRYERDLDHLRAYVRDARTDEGFDAYLAAHVTGERTAA